MNRPSNRSRSRFLRAVLASGAFLCFFAAPPAPAQCPPVEMTKVIGLDTAGGDNFGWSVSIDGDTAIVGADFESNAGGTAAGAAYVFVRSGGVWTQQAKLTASDAAADDGFGHSVAIDGDTAIVGAHQDDHAGGSQAGSAYVFIRMDSVWSQQAKLIASDAAAGDGFGNSVALFGDTAVVGSHYDDHSALSSAGAAYVFNRCGVSWPQQAKLTASDAAAADQFGDSVAIDENWLIVGASSDDHAAGTNAGSAYVFARAGTFWSQIQKLTASDAAADDFFGRAVALEADTALIGAHTDDHAGGLNAGSAYVFIRVAGVWSQQAKLTASDAEPGESFGISVTVSGDGAVVGAQNDDDLAIAAGSAYVFARTGSVWAQQAKLLPTDGGPLEIFGASVALSGSRAFVGCPRDDHAGGSVAGSVFWFDLTCDADGDGVIDANDVCPNNAPGLPVDCAGRPLRDCNSDCLLDSADIDCIVAEMLG